MNSSKLTCETDSTTQYSLGKKPAKRNPNVKAHERTVTKWIHRMALARRHSQCNRVQQPSENFENPQDYSAQLYFIFSYIQIGKKMNIIVIQTFRQEIELHIYTGTKGRWKNVQYCSDKNG